MLLPRGTCGGERKDRVCLSALCQPECISAAFVSKPCRTSGYMAAASIPASQMAGNDDALLFYRVWNWVSLNILQQDLVENGGAVWENVSARFVYLRGDRRSVDAERMRCWIFFRYVVMETNIWLKAFSTVTMMSQSGAACWEKALWHPRSVLSLFSWNNFHCCCQTGIWRSGSS